MDTEKQITAKEESEKRKAAITESVHIIADHSMPINWHLKDILAEMCYHLGSDKVRSYKAFITALANNNYIIASNELIKSDWHDQQPEDCERLARELTKL